jgi:hypothetical protein
MIHALSGCCDFRDHDMDTMRAAIGESECTIKAGVMTLVPSCWRISAEQSVLRSMIDICPQRMKSGVDLVCRPKQLQVQARVPFSSHEYSIEKEIKSA